MLGSVLMPYGSRTAQGAQGPLVLKVPNMLEVHADPAHRLCTGLEPLFMLVRLCESQEDARTALATISAVRAAAARLQGNLVPFMNQGGHNLAKAFTAVRGPATQYAHVRCLWVLMRMSAAFVVLRAHLEVLRAAAHFQGCDAGLWGTELCGEQRVSSLLSRKSVSCHLQSTYNHRSAAILFFVTHLLCEQCATQGGVKTAKEHEVLHACSNLHLSRTSWLLLPKAKPCMI